MRLTAKVYHEGVWYERELAEYFWYVAFWNIFPPRRETVAAFVAWAKKGK